MNIKSFRRMGYISKEIINIIIPLIMTVSTNSELDVKTAIYDLGKNIKLRICNFNNDDLTDPQFSCYFGKGTLDPIKNHLNKKSYTDIESGCAYIDIYNVSNTDIGQYICGVNAKIKGKQLIVQGEPTVKINGKNLTSVTANEPSIITCERNGSRETELTIKLGNKDLGGTITFLSLYLANKRIIYNFDMIETQKNLTCSAAVKNGSEFDNVQMINVHDSPCINETRKFEFMYNDNVTLRKCSNLRFNNSRIYRSINASIDIGNDTIYHVPPNKTGTYTCIRNDEKGNRAYCYYNINFEDDGKLKFLNCHRNVSKYKVTLDSNTNLSCSLSSSSKIIFYEWYYKGQLIGTTQTYLVTGKENNSYYNCTAENEDGNLETCLHIIILTNQLMLPIHRFAAGAAVACILIMLLTIICIIIQRHKYKFHLKSPRSFYNSVVYYFAYRNDTYEKSRNDKNDDIVTKTPRLEVSNLSLVGVGNFGPVYRGYSKTLKGRSFRKPLTVAVKLPQMRMLQSEMGKRYTCQIDIHYQLAAHKNVISCYGRTHYNGIIGSVLEYAHNGTLKSYLQTLFKQYFIEPDENDDRNISELNSVCLQFCREIAAGMSHLNQNDIIHMNLSAKNVLLGRNFICKIADFGLNYMCVSNGHLSTYYDPIPIRWMSPESITYNSYTMEGDVWSYGIVLWEIITLGFTPYFEFKTGAAVKEAIQVQYRMKFPNHSSAWLNDLIENCWSESPIYRTSFEQIESAFQNLPTSFLCIDFTKYNSATYENANLNVYREII